MSETCPAPAPGPPAKNFGIGPRSPGGEPRTENRVPWHPIRDPKTPRPGHKNTSFEVKKDFQQSPPGQLDITVGRGPRSGSPGQSRLAGRPRLEIREPGSAQNGPARRTCTGATFSQTITKKIRMAFTGKKTCYPAPRSVLRDPYESSLGHCRRDPKTALRTASKAVGEG